MSVLETVDLKAKLESFSEQWSPKIIGELNGQQVKLVKIQGEFIWHRHEQEDELFLVLDGSMTMEFRNRTISLEVGQMIIVPRGVEHRPVAIAEAHLLLFEPATTRNTGDVVSERTVAQPDRI